MPNFTPAGVTVQAVLPDGSTEDVTEGVQALYDLVTQSLDWGSGFWTVEDAAPVAHLARVCGFAGADKADDYIAQRKEEAEALRQRQNRRF